MSRVDTTNCSTGGEAIIGRICGVDAADVLATSAFSQSRKDSP